MRCDYKVIPVRPNPAFPNEKSTWLPILPIRLSHGHGKQTPRIEAMIDSGAGHCLFKADICPVIGIKLEIGIRGETGGIVRGRKVDVYYHGVHLWVGADRISIMAGFSQEIAVAALLGRRGFFENFIVTFDPTNSPPGFTIQRLGRA